MKLPLKFQVCSYKQSLVLKELLKDIALTSVWVWIPAINQENSLDEFYELVLSTDKRFRNLAQTGAYTSSELGTMLPPKVKNSKGLTLKFKLRKLNEPGGMITYSAEYCDGRGRKRFFKESRYEAQAKAELLIHILENEYINITDIIL